MIVETEILGNKERHNEIVRYGFENLEETAMALGCIGVAKSLYFESNNNGKNGKLILPHPNGPRITSAENFEQFVGEVNRRTKMLQLQEKKPDQSLLGQYKSYSLWNILEAVNSNENKEAILEGTLPLEYSENIWYAGYLMKALDAGKKIGKTAVRQLYVDHNNYPIKLNDAVVSYESNDKFTSLFPLNYKATVATSRIPESTYL